MFSENIPVFVPLTGARQSQGKPRSKKAGPRTRPSAEGGVNRPQAKGSRARPRQKAPEPRGKETRTPGSQGLRQGRGPRFPPTLFHFQVHRWQQRGLTARTLNLGRGAHYGSPIKTQGGDKPTGKWPNGPWQGKKPTGHKVAASRRHKGDSPSRTPPFTLRQCTGQPWGSGRGDTQPKVF